MGVFYSFAQTQISGVVRDDMGNPVANALIYYEDYSAETESNDNGEFSLYSKKKQENFIVSAVGFREESISLNTANSNFFNLVLKPENELKEIIIYSGRTSKKNNPAIDILRKVWENRKNNGLNKFNQYAYNKYEKLQFDFNTIDSTFMKNALFKNMDLVFQFVDTSKITGKSFLPIFINEQASKVYGDNTKNLKIEKLLGNKNSGFEDNTFFTEVTKELYKAYDIYDNYIKLFNKDFTSPISRTGIDVYNYVLHDTLIEDDRKSFHIVYYPRRKGGLTFRGEFFVDEQTWAVTKINMYSNEGADVNWIKEFFIEQEFVIVSDDLILLKKDFIMTDFSLSKKEEARGMYAKRTTHYNDFVFDDEKPASFYLQIAKTYDPTIYNQSEYFWQNFRAENLNKNEANIYEMLDQLQDNPKFKTLTTLTQILTNGYYRGKNFDYGNLFTFFGYNDIEGIRTRIGGRTFFNQNDQWRLEGYLAYGWKDQQFKYALQAKKMLVNDWRLIGHIGYKNDVEQLAGQLMQSSNLMKSEFASSSLLAGGDNSKLTHIQHFSTGFEIEPLKNIRLRTSYNYRQLQPADFSRFSTAFFQDGVIKDQIKQHEWNVAFDFTPNRKVAGFGVEQKAIVRRFPRFFLNFTQGFDGLTDTDFAYQKLQFLYRHPFTIGGFGHMTAVVEAGKTWGTVPLSLLNVLPGNQSYFVLENGFSQLDYYEFVTDQYVTFHITHNFNGKIFSRIPLIRKLKWREIIGIRGAWGAISDKNKLFNRSMISYNAPSDKLYYEYFVGVGNIFKVFRIDFSWRGNYLDTPNARRFGIKGGFEINF